MLGFVMSSENNPQTGRSTPRTSRRTVLKYSGAAGVAGLAGLAGCLGDDEDDDRVLIPGIHDTSGATSDVGAPAAEGTIDTWEYINDNDLLDAEVNHDWVDYAYEVEEATRAYDDYLDDGPPPAIIGWGTADTEALAPRVADDEIVYISASYSEALMQPETDYNFFIKLDYSSQARVLLEWIADNDPGSMISFFHHNSPFGESPVGPGEEYAQELGLEVGSRQELPGGAASAESQLISAREEDVDYILHQSTAAPMEVLVSDAQDVYPEVEIMGLTYTTDELRTQESPEAFEGVRYASAFDTFEEALDSDPGGDLIRELWEDYRDESMDNIEIANLNYVRGVLHALVAFRALEHVEEMGLDPHDGSDFREAMFEIEDWDGWGMVEPLTYTEDDRRPTMTGRVYEVQDGEMVRDEIYELERRAEWIEG